MRCVAKGIGFDGGEDFREVRVEREGAVVVRVAEVFDVFGEVAEEEDVGVADFAGYFDLYFISMRKCVEGVGRGLTFAPSQVPIIKPPLSTNFMLLVPLASVPAVEMCSLISDAGVMISALLTL